MFPDEWLLRRLCRSPRAADYSVSEKSAGVDDALSLLTAEYPDLSARVAGKRVADFGCGHGSQSCALARRFGCRVVGLDTNEKSLNRARERAATEGFLETQVQFADSVSVSLNESFDVVISQNAMEHFSEPEAVLQRMRQLVRPGGHILITFGPPWYSPYGSHMHFFCKVPWLNLLFRESTVMRVRSLYRADGATRYEDVESGLNKMSLRRFDQLLGRSQLEVEALRFRVVRGQDWLAKIPLMRELFVNHVTCTLRRT